MLKNIAQLKDVIEGREISLSCDLDCPIPVLKEFLFRCQKWVGNIEDQVKAKQDQDKAEADAKAASEAPVEDKVVPIAAE